MHRTVLRHVRRHLELVMIVQHHLHRHHLLLNITIITLSIISIRTLIPPTMNSCRRQVHRPQVVEEQVLLDLHLGVVVGVVLVLLVVVVVLLELIVRKISTVHKECLGIFLLIR